MITAQEIREKMFEKSKFSGYDMASVDDFLEELADDVAAAQKDNAVLKSKMKVLVDKIEEYRANEETLNLAIISAQKLAVQIESEARAKADAMIAEAEAKAAAVVGNIQEQTAYEESRLEAAKASFAGYVAALRDICNNQLAAVDEIESGLAAEEAAPAVDDANADIEEAMRSIRDSVSRMQPETSMDLDIESMMGTAPAAGAFDSTQPFTI